jgi:hypothetical protein
MLSLMSKAINAQDTLTVTKYNFSGGRNIDLSSFSDGVYYWKLFDSSVSGKFVTGRITILKV